MTGQATAGFAASAGPRDCERRFGAMVQARPEMWALWAGSDSARIRLGSSPVSYSRHWQPESLNYIWQAPVSPGFGPHRLAKAFLRDP